MDKRKKIVVIDDEEDIRELLEFNLMKAGFAVVLQSEGQSGLEAIRAHSPNLIILDLMLPGLHGLDICRIVKNDRKLFHIPIIMLTAKGEEQDIITGLELGADDYITKPFSIQVLIARIKTVLRRVEMGRREISRGPLSIGNLFIDLEQYRVVVNGSEVKLTPTEFGILKTLAENGGRVFTRLQLLNKVQGSINSGADRTIDVHLTSLRRKLGESGKLIQTVRGVGYRLTGENEK